MKRTDYLKIRERCKEILINAFTPNIWQSQTSYSPDSLIKPSVENGHYYRCKMAGTSGENEPDWPKNFWEEVNDGTITWREEEPVFILDYEEELKYPAIVVGEIRPISEIQIALGNKVSNELRIDLFIISYLKNKTWQQMRLQAFDICSYVQKAIRENPTLNNLPGVLEGRSGIYTISESLPSFYKLNLLWFVKWKEK